MQAIANPMALKLSDEVRQTVTPDDFVNDTLNRKSELEELREYVLRREQKKAQKATEEMLVSALQAKAPLDVIEFMRQRAGMSESRLLELKNQAILA